MSQKPTESPSFDQIVKGNVSIKKSKSSKDRYTITFSKIGKFLVYQVWDKDSVILNKKRKVGYLSAKDWVKDFKKGNERLEEENGKPLFRPTTIMETEDDDIYAFVIHKACLNSHGQVVFTVSTKEISLQNNTSKKMVRLPSGKCNNVRFDIDFITFPTEPCILYPTFSPINSNILDNIKFTYTKLAGDRYALTYTDNNIYKDSYTYTAQPLPSSPNISIKNILQTPGCRYYHNVLVNNVNVPIDLGISRLYPRSSNITGGIGYLESPSLRFIVFTKIQDSTKIGGYFYVDVDRDQKVSLSK